MTFSDFLNAPLPSKQDILLKEGVEDNIDTEVDELDDVNASDPAIDSDDIGDIEDNDDDEFDPDDYSDEELAELDRELSDDAASAVVDRLPGDDKEVKLTPSEEMEADDMMKVAATSMLVNDQLNVEERVAFLSNQDEVATAINEGFLTESDVNLMSVGCGLITEAKYTNKMIIRLNAEAKKKQLYALAVNVSAAAHHDPDYIKYKKALKLKKIYRMKLERKYHNEATKRARVYFARLKKSRSTTLSKIGNNAER